MVTVLRDIWDPDHSDSIVLDGLQYDSLQHCVCAQTCWPHFDQALKLCCAAGYEVKTMYVVCKNREKVEEAVKK